MKVIKTIQKFEESEVTTIATSYIPVEATNIQVAILYEKEGHKKLTIVFNSISEYVEEVPLQFSKKRKTTKQEDIFQLTESVKQWTHDKFSVPLEQIDSIVSFYESCVVNK